MTVHQAKGLEWPIVFVPCLTNLRFPTKKTGQEQKWHIPREMFDVDRYEGSVNDERKLFYVAITSAKDLLCLSRFRRINKATGESPFLNSVRGNLTKLNLPNSLPIVEVSKASDEEEIHTFSAGEIINFLKCPHFYRLRELWNYQPGLVTPLGYGKSLHFCLRCASELIRAGESPQTAILKAIDEKFHLPYAGGAVRQNMKNKAQMVLLKFVEEHLDDMGRIEEVEARLEFPVQKATITGRVDVIIKNDGHVEARDYKTSDEVTTPEQSALQLRLYALGLKSIGKPISKASIATLEEAEIKPVDVSEENIVKAQETAEIAIHHIKGGHFSPQPGKFCGACDYSRICSSCQETA